VPPLVLKPQACHIWCTDERVEASRHHIWRPRSLRPGDLFPSQAEGERKATRGAPLVVEKVPRIHLPSACRSTHYANPPPRGAQMRHTSPNDALNASSTLQRHPDHSWHWVILSNALH